MPAINEESNEASIVSYEMKSPKVEEKEYFSFADPVSVHEEEKEIYNDISKQ